MAENKRLTKATNEAPVNWGVQARRLYVQSVRQTNYEDIPGTEVTYSERPQDAIVYKEYAAALRMADYVGHNARVVILPEVTQND